MIVSPASAALITSSVVILSTVTVPSPVVSTVCVEVVSTLIAFPASSVPVAVTVNSVSSLRSEPATSADQFPEASTVA